MHRFNLSIPYSATSLCFGAIAVLSTVYIGLIAVVMSYAALTIEFSQSVGNNEAVVAVLEGRYLKNVARITEMNYAAEGYSKPITKIFVRAESSTALLR